MPARGQRLKRKRLFIRLPDLHSSGKSETFPTPSSLIRYIFMKSAPNKRRWIIPAAWLATAAAAFSIGRMSSWLEEPVVVPGTGAGSGAGGGSAGSDSTGAAGNRVGSVQMANGEMRPLLTVGEVTGGQPLEDWLKKLMAQDDDIYRMQNFVKLFDALNSPEDIKAALKVISASGRGGGGGRGGMRFTEYSMLLQKLTQMDAKGAIAFANEGNGGERWMATGTVLRTWTKSEPEAALAWAKENGVQPNAENDGDRRGGGNDNWALASVVTQLAKTNLDKALQEAMSGELGRTAGRTAEALVGETVDQRGIDAAMKIAEGLPEGEFQNDFVRQVADRLGNADPEKGTIWANNLPSGPLKAQALGSVLDQWMDKDPAKAFNYVKPLPVSPDYDRARIEVAQGSARNNPDNAIAMISGISDPQSQTRTTYRIAGDIYRQNQAAGQDFVMKSPLPEENKSQFLQQLQQQQQRGPGGGGPGGGGPGFGGGGFRRGGGGGGGR
jgi:hypothetical protein